MQKFLATLILTIYFIMPAYAQTAIDPAQAYAVALAGTPKDVKKLLHAGYDVNQPYQCNTLLTAAVKSVAYSQTLPETFEDSLRKVSLLLNNGADVNFNPCPDGGLLPLSWALSLPSLLEHEQEEALNSLDHQIANTADYCDYPRIASKPCRYLTADEKAKIVQAIKDEFTVKTKKIMPDLMRIIKLLVKRGAIIDKEDFNKQTALHYAAAMPKEVALEPLKYLLSKGANPVAKNAEGQTPLFFAQALNNQEAVNLLIQYGSDATIQDTYGFMFNQSLTATFRRIIDDKSVLLEIIY
ncbi:MAG: ankyrin repeat domain-containing protein [Alphaproteobacteria bacterium]|nr:ankyrin repeat domain-containing protein [Alphaproteobacteria bacterium]